jgi:DNA-directed RNA polymerase subunit M/transcription elongation factor TFIIS
MENSENTPKVFSCEKCDYHTRDSKDYKKHLTTRKHSRNYSIIPSSENTEEERKKHICENCDKIYGDYSGLWKHKKKCSPRENPVNVLNPAPEVTPSAPTPEMYYELQEKYRQLYALQFNIFRHLSTPGVLQ